MKLKIVLVITLGMTWDITPTPYMYGIQSTNN